MSKDDSTLLKQFIDQINKHLKALEALNVPVDNWDLLLIHLYSKNLSYNTQHAFEMGGRRAAYFDRIFELFGKTLFDSRNTIF